MKEIRFGLWNHCMIKINELNIKLLFYFELTDINLCSVEENKIDLCY